MKRINYLFVIPLVLLAAGCLTSGTGQPEPAEDAGHAQIYAAAIRQIYSVDHSFGSPEGGPQWPLVYVSQ